MSNVFWSLDTYLTASVLFCHIVAATTSVIFQCYRCVTTANSLLQVKVDSVTDRDDSLMDSLDLCYMKYLLFWVKTKCSLTFSLTAEAVFEHIENVNSNSIICETLTIPVQKTSDSGN